MEVDHGFHDDGDGNRRTLGCIAGVTITLYPKEAAKAAKELAVPGVPRICDPGDVAQEVLGLDPERGGVLYNEYPDKPAELPVTPEQAALAVERILTGADPEDTWKQVDATSAASDEDTEQTASHGAA
jgi:hypothetical protein